MHSEDCFVPKYSIPMITLSRLFSQICQKERFLLPKKFFLGKYDLKNCVYGPYTPQYIFSKEKPYQIKLI